MTDTPQSGSSEGRSPPVPLDTGGSGGSGGPGGSGGSSGSSGSHSHHSSGHSGHHSSHHSSRHHRHQRRSAPKAALVLRIVGWTALVAALTLGGFLVYELWYTNVQARNAQGGLETDFAERVQAATATATTVTAAYHPEVYDLAPIVVPDYLDGVAGLDTGLLPEEVVEAPQIIGETAPERGQSIGRITIETAQVDWVVVEGTSLANLTNGAGHVPWTPLPGQPGNAVVSGHRTTNGAPFRHLNQVQLGDLITFTTAIGTHIYQVVETRVVNPTETWVTDQWRGAWLTLTTCDPPMSAAKRLVVTARLIDGPNAAAILAAA